MQEVGEGRSRPDLSALNQWLDKVEREPGGTREAPNASGRDQEAARSAGQPVFEVSVEDFTARARTEGWEFWRGMITGFFAGSVLTYGAVVGEQLLPL